MTIGRWLYGTARIGAAAARLPDSIARSSFVDYPTRDHTAVTAAAGAQVSYGIAHHWRVGLAEQSWASVALTDHTRASVNVVLAGFSYEFGP